MTSYKLSYFDVRGRGEVCRMVFAQAEVEYEDERITSAEWESSKGDRTRFPMGCVPTLAIDGEIMIQSTVIARHLARKFGLGGQDEKEMTMVDMMSDLCNDMLTEFFESVFEEDAKRKEDNSKKFVKKSDTYLAMFTGWLAKNGDGNGFLVGDKMTLADIALLNLLEQLAGPFADMLTKNPSLQAFLERMKKEPKIAAWLEKRPKGMMDI